MKYSLHSCLLLLLVSTFLNLPAQEVDGGNGHSIMLDPDGVVWTVGRNNFGQLGNGSHQDVHIPIAVEGLPKIVRISRGYDHSLGIDEGGAIWAWGRNNYGQLCDPNFQDHTRPQKIDAARKYVSVEGGLYHTMALATDGSVWAWGHNFYAELGSGNREHSANAVRVRCNTEDRVHAPLTNIVEIKSVGYHGMALDSAGRVWTWGGNSSYQLGHEIKGHQAFATVLEEIPNMQSIASGWHHSLALDSTGTMWQWGTDQSLMDVSERRYIKTPEKVPATEPMSQIACGSWHSMSIDNEGQVWAWGRNKKGMLGTADTIASAIPVKAQGMSCALSIGAGCFQSLVVDSLGQMWSFGGNHNGQLAVDHDEYELAPAKTFFTMDEGATKEPESTELLSSTSSSGTSTLQRIWLIISPLLIVLLLAWNIRARKPKRTLA
jgi:alpha-tubulin suppressor-like RCC1 family protein